MFTTGVQPTLPIHTKDGKPVPIARVYKYLGINTLDLEEDWKMKKGKAWGALKALDPIWPSSLDMETKRNLFYSLVEPILTYGVWTWPLTRTFLNRLDGCFGRMLRYALGLPPVSISRHTHHTEEVYGGHDFLSTMVLCRRLSFLGHALREHVENRRFHYCIEM